MTGSRRAALKALVEGESVTRLFPPALLPAEPFFDLAGEEFGRRLFLTTTNSGHDLCLRPEFTLPIARHYIDSGGFGRPAAYTYLGPVFRQGEEGPDEFEQAGIECLGMPYPDAALNRVLGFAAETLAAYDIASPRLRIGGVGLFEAFIEAADLPQSWRARIRHRLGHPYAMERLLDRLARPLPVSLTNPETRESAVDRVAELMLASGLTVGGSRMPEEIAERYLEQRALEAAPVPARTVRLLRDYLAISGSPGQALDRALALARAYGIDLEAPVTELGRVVEAATALIPGGDVVFEAGFSPGLDYYTGVVFELTGRDGAVLASGGQYDRLLQRLGAPGPLAAAGCAVWADRLVAEAP